MTDDGYDSKNKKNLPAYVRTYVRRKVFYTLSVISVIRPLRRICNPTASSISICNALINNQETQNIFTHLKCLYSLRLDCKSNRAREYPTSVLTKSRCTISEEKACKYRKYSLSLPPNINNRPKPIAYVYADFDISTGNSLLSLWWSDG